MVRVGVRGERMKVSVISSQRNSSLMKRLQLLGFGVQVGEADVVKAVDRLEADRVYLVSYDMMSSEEWPNLRVRLARAGRYYVVFGSELGTREIMAAARDGAHDVVMVSDEDERWEEAINYSGHSQQLWWQLYGGNAQTDSNRLTGRSGAIKTLGESVQRLGPTDATVLITGESGTGKERVAEALHSAAGKGSFVAVNCAAIPNDLMESELFGVSKGAFTGAVKDKPGLVDEAAGGTLFLDEIGEMDTALQPKLLRFLETHHAHRVGSTKEYKCDVRVISATNRELEEAVDEGEFRADLYYRLSEVILHIPPPLRHRTEDIPDLVNLFIKDSAERYGKNFESLDPELIYKFQQFDWPGNVRELKQAIDRLAILYDGPIMRNAWWDLPKRPESRMSGEGRRGVDGLSPNRRAREKKMEDVVGRYGIPSKREKMNLAKQLLRENGHDLTWVAAQLGVHPTTLYRWRKSGKV